MQVHEVYYQQHAFRFAPDADDALTGRLLLDEAQRALLAQLLEAEEEAWYLDEDGERLPAQELFARLPWSCCIEMNTIKLLCRSLDCRAERVLFSTPDSYLEADLTGKRKKNSPESLLPARG